MVKGEQVVEVIARILLAHGMSRLSKSTTSYVGKQRRVSASRYPCADNHRRGMQSEPDGSHRQRDRSLP